MKILTAIARFSRALAFAYRERAELLKQIAALNTMVVMAKAETAQALLNDIADSATITAANAALEQAQAQRDAAVEAATEAVEFMQKLQSGAATLQTLKSDDAVEDRKLDGMLSGIEFRIPEDFSMELERLAVPAQQAPIAKPPMRRTKE